MRPRVFSVDLVDHHDHLEAGLQGLFQDKTRLRQRPFGGIHQKDGAVGHGERPFHLAPEVGMSGGVDDVDLHPVPDHGTVLGGNGDAALAFQIHIVHNPGLNLLAFAEHAALAEHGVYKGGLPMVYMGNNGDVSDALIFCGLIHGDPFTASKARIQQRSALSAIYHVDSLGNRILP